MKSGISGLLALILLYYAMPSSRAGNLAEIGIFQDDLTPPSSCPIVIEPGKSLHGIKVGKTREELKADKIQVNVDSERVSGSADTGFYVSGAFHIATYEKRVKIIWLHASQDSFPKCLVYKGKKITEKLTKLNIPKLFEDCKIDDTEGLSGWSASCEKSGLKFYLDDLSIPASLDISVEDRSDFLKSQADVKAVQRYCPMQVTAGERIGPVRIGASIVSLENLGFALTHRQKSGDQEYLDAGIFHIVARKGVIAEIRVSDLRAGPDCWYYGKKKIPLDLATENIGKFFLGCTRPDPRDGGVLVPCEQGKLTLGYGMGTFLDIRINDGTWLGEEAVDRATGNFDYRR